MGSIPAFKNVNVILIPNQITTDTDYETTWEIL